MASGIIKNICVKITTRTKIHTLLNRKKAKTKQNPTSEYSIVETVKII